MFLLAATLGVVAIAGLFVVTAITSARTALPPATPVASVGQIMNELTVPASDTVFKAVSTVSTANGVEETTPKTDQEWQRVEASAAMVAESANLLLLRTQIADQAEWISMSRALVKVSQVALDAARHKNPGALVSSYEAIYAACENCHLKYLPARP